jgi:transcriptional regulator with XRE-family HTH domain
MNLALQAAMTEAGETAESLAAQTGVDPKTAARWISPGRVPQPRRRAAVAAILGRDINDLWPDVLKRREPQWLRKWVDWEREAVALRWFEHAWVPGLLQTEAYARATLAHNLLTSNEIEERVASRLERSAILLSNKPVQLVAVIDVMVLRRPLKSHPAAMKEQLAHLAEMAELAHVQILVVGEDAGLYPGLQGGFILGTLGDGSVVAHLDHQVRAQVVDQTEDLVTLQQTWEAIRGEAFSRKQSLDLIKKAAQTWT